MKTSEMQGFALDWAVMAAEGGEWSGKLLSDGTLVTYTGRLPITTRLWAAGGPIIERERIHLAHSHFKGHWVAFIANSDCGNVFGPTPLVAAMRCYVASKMGDEIEVPEELK